MTFLTGNFIDPSQFSKLENAIDFNIQAEAEVEKAAKEIEQGTISWFKRRLGKITGSKFSIINTKETKWVGNLKQDLIDWINNHEDFELVENLKIEAQSATGQEFEKITVKDLKSFIADKLPGQTDLTQGAKTYMNELLWECQLDDTLLNDEIPKWMSATSASMRWGHLYEGEARKVYGERMGYEVEEVGVKFLQKDGIIAASSDGLVRLKDGGVGVTEFKCPWNGANHQNILTAILDNAEGREVYELFDQRYKEQYLGNMLVHGAKWCDFGSYDPRLKNEYNRLAVVRLTASEFAVELEDLRQRLIFFKGIYLKAVEKQGLTIPQF
jgi:hypothetical protein